MDRLTAAIYSRLSTDATLTSTLNALVRQAEVPSDPKLVTRPFVTFRVAGGPDLAGRHGAAILARVEMDVWGYGEVLTADWDNVLPVCTRLDILMLASFYTETGGSPDGGWTTRGVANPGFQVVEQPDPMVIRLNSGYDMLYWSAQRVAAL